VPGAPPQPAGGARDWVDRLHEPMLASVPGREIG
jgi:hypothetical protein